MKTYQAVKAEIAKLEARAEALRKSELKSVIAQVKKTIAEFGLTAADLGLGRGTAKARGGARGGRAKGVAKYRDPKTGQTWTGHGRPPAWIVDVKDRTPFLIDGAAAEAAPAKKARAGRPAAKAARSAGRKRAAKTAAKAPARKARAAKPRAARKSGAVQIESGVAAE